MMMVHSTPNSALGWRMANQNAAMNAKTVIAILNVKNRRRLFQ